MDRLPRPGNSPIRWDVASVTSPGTPSRSLVGPAPEEGQTPDWITLEQACTPTAAGGKGLAIGIWADYTYEDLQGDEITIKNLFSGTRLIYANKTNGNPYSYWNYEGEDLYWYIGAGTSSAPSSPRRSAKTSSRRPAPPPS